jgi:predicted DNA-binding antitoxin AbrB/MazE fold protein
MAEVIMTQVDAIYQGGVFKPLGPVALSENQRVLLGIEPVDVQDAAAWLEETDRLRNSLAAKYGVFPDSTLDIAADRAR